MLADDGRIANLPVRLRELVVRETDRARLVCELGLLQRSTVQGDGSRLIAVPLTFDYVVRLPPAPGQRKRHETAFTSRRTNSTFAALRARLGELPPVLCASREGACRWPNCLCPGSLLQGG